MVVSLARLAGAVDIPIRLAVTMAKTNLIFMASPMALFALPRPIDASSAADRHGARLAHAVDQAEASIGTLLNVPQVESATMFRRFEERLPFTGDQRINHQPEL